MKRLLIVLLTLICAFSVIGCGETEPKPVTDEYASHKQVLALCNSYSAIGTNGYDYTLEQKSGETIVNAHTVSLRLDNTNGTIGSRFEHKKELNEDISKGQYTETEATAYYKDNKIATYSAEAWTWKDCTLEEFVSVDIKSFAFDIDSVSSAELSTEGEFTTLSFKIEDAKAAEFLEITGDIKDLSFVIKTDSAITTFVSLTMSYSQSLTTTCFSFMPYSGGVNIDIPE